MKKNLYFLFSVVAVLFLMTGCDSMYNTPTKKVEMMLANYQTLNEDVMDDLDKVVAEEEKFNTKQREAYRELMKKHYQDLTYDIKEEKIDGDKATVTVQIEVNDYSKIMKKTRKYLNDNPDKFKNNKGEYDDEKFVDYQLGELKKNKERVKYTMDIDLTKKDKEWKLDKLTDEQEQKLHGMYEY